MRKNISVLGLFAGSTFYPFLAMLGLFTVAETGLFLRACYTYDAPSVDYPLLETVLQHSCFGWVFGTAFLITAVCLCLTGCEFSGKQGYTLRRLGISELQAFFCQATYDSICFFLLWVWQTLVIYVLSKLHTLQAMPEYAGSQTMFLAFYRDDFIHNLMPLADVTRWLRNILLVPLLGFGCSYFPLLQRKGKFAVITVITLILAVLCFVDLAMDYYAVDLAVVALAVIFIGFIILRARGEVSSYDEI